MSKRDAGLAALESALAAQAAPLVPPLALDGARLEFRVRPTCGESLATTLRLCTEHRLALRVRGGGSRDALGHPGRVPDLLVDTTALAGVEELDSGEGVLRARAGTSLVALQDALIGSGWELPLDPPGALATLGGTLAAAAPGPRFERPRDVVLGLDVALASGQRASCGGRVVKNVTGYDLAKLYVGSLGALAVIEAAWLRLRPIPEQTSVWLAPLARGVADARALRIARLATARAAVAIDAGSARQLGLADDACLVVELAGEPRAVAADASRLADVLAAELTSGSVLERVRELLAEQPGELMLRLGVLPARLPAAAERLAAAGARLLAWPARGALFASFLAAAATDATAEKLLAAVREAARLGEGVFRIESAPAALRRGAPVFGDAGAGSVRLARSVKQRFDPDGILAPGRLGEAA